MGNNLSIRIGKITKNCKQIKFIEGRMGKSDAETKRLFKTAKEFSIPFVAEGFYCIDLFDEKNQNILQTTTITPQAYRNLTEGKQK